MNHFVIASASSTTTRQVPITKCCGTTSIQAKSLLVRIIICLIVLIVRDLIIFLVSKALYTDGHWYRAQVISAQFGVGINVFYFDYGSRCTLGLIHVRRLDSQFAHIPKQAFLGRIDGFSSNTNWSDEGRSCFFDTVKGELQRITNNFNINEVFCLFFKDLK